MNIKGNTSIDCSTGIVDGTFEHTISEETYVSISQSFSIPPYEEVNISVKAVRFHGSVPLYSIQEQKVLHDRARPIVLKAVEKYNLAHSYWKGKVDTVILAWNGTAEIDIAHDYSIEVVGMKIIPSLRNILGKFASYFVAKQSILIPFISPVRLEKVARKADISHRQLPETRRRVTASTQHHEEGNPLTDLPPKSWEIVIQCENTVLLMLIYSIFIPF
jgi:hypothetical protein